MESTQQSDHETYRAIVLGQCGDELLLVPASNGFVLPMVEIPRWQRISEHLTAAMRKEWGQEVVCLFSPDVDPLSGSTNGCNYQVMESCGAVAKSRSEIEWVGITSLSAAAFADPADYMAVQRTLSECKGYPDGMVPGPFARLGWFRELQGWIEEVIGSSGFHLTGSFVQLNAGPSFSLVRFETSGLAVWFKAVGKPNLREFPITIALAKLLPQYVPAILAVQREWNGWLAWEAEGTNLGETQSTHLWKAAASALAKLQIESIGRCKPFVASGARDLRTPVLLKLVHPFLDAMSQLMEKQTKVPPSVLSRSELKLLGEQIEEALSRSTDLGIPDALGHLDLNPRNVVVGEGRSAFLDWAEAYVGYPFFSFQYLVEHFRRMAGVDATAEAVLTSAYSEEWQSLVAPESLQEALALTPMLAVFVYAAANDLWGGQDRLQDPKVAGYLRSLTRRTHREANRLKDRSAPCQN